MKSPQMQNLLDRYGVQTEEALLKALAAEYTEECCDPGEEPFLPEDMAAVLDQLLEAEYQRIAGGAYDTSHPTDEDWDEEAQLRAEAEAEWLEAQFKDPSW
jgi:hypothetical protein